MEALVYDGTDDMEVRNIPAPEIQEPTDVIIEVECALSSNAEIRDLYGEEGIQEGHILGTEFAGSVHETGSSVTAFEPGDRVVPGVMTHCGECFYCQRGIWSSCENGGWVIGRVIDGGRAEYARIPMANKNLYRIPDGVEFEEAVFAMSSLPTGFEGVTACNVQPGDTVAIIGPGPIGLCTLECAKLWSPEEIIMVGRNERYLDIAEEMDADSIIHANAEDSVENLQNRNGSYGPDAVIETAGNEQVYSAAIRSVRVGGAVALMGFHKSNYDLPMMDIWKKNLDIFFGFVNANSIDKILSLIANGRLQVEPLISDTIDLSDIDSKQDLIGREVVKKLIYP